MSATTMRLLIVGHDYAKSLESYIGTSFVIDGVTFEAVFYHKKAGSYADFLEDNTFFEQSRVFEPDFVVVILAGNSILQPINIFQRDCTDFYAKLRSNFQNSTIISARVENGFIH